MEQALESCFAQDYSNIEILLVNHGSIDNAAINKIRVSYADKIIYLEKEKSNVATALNAGIEAMTGQFFCSLYTNAIYHPSKISAQIKLWKDQGEPERFFYYTNYYNMRDGSFKITEQSNPDVCTLERKPLYGLLRGLIQDSSVFLPKLFFKEQGLFNLTLDHTYDYDLWRRALATPYKFYYIHQPFIQLRQAHEHGFHKTTEIAAAFNALWIQIINDISVHEAVALEGSEYGFYREMEDWLLENNMLHAAHFSREKAEILLQQLSKKYRSIKVSVIIPYFNRDQDVFEAIRSVQAQTHSNIEIIVVDDGSTEPMPAVNALISQCDNIHCLYQENRGPAAARNTGIAAATGDYIAFLDSDDLFLSSKISEQLDAMINTNVVFCHTSYLRYFRNQKGMKLMKSGQFSGQVIPNIISRCPVAMPTVMVRRKLFTDLSLRFSEQARIGEDVGLWIKIAKSYPFLGLERPLSIVRASAESAAYNQKKMEQGLRNIKAVIEQDPDLACFTGQKAELDTALSNVTREDWGLAEHKESKKNIFLDQLYQLQDSNCLDQALALIKSEIDSRQDRPVWLLIELGTLFILQRNWTEAEKIFFTLFELSQKGSSSGTQFQMGFHLACAMAAAGKYEAAKSLFYIPLQLPLYATDCVTDSSILAVGENYQKILTSYPLDIEIEWGPSYLQDRQTGIFFLACDSIYFTRFFLPAFNAFRANSGLDWGCHIHVADPTPEIRALAERLVSEKQTVAFSFSVMPKEAMEFRDMQNTYYSVLRYLLLPILLQYYKCQILLTDIDLITVAPLASFISHLRGKDAACLYRSQKAADWLAEYSSTIMLVSPNDSGQRLTNLLRRYIDHMIDSRRLKPGLANAALASIIHQQPELTIAQLSENILQSEQIELRSHSPLPFFWHINASIKANRLKANWLFTNSTIIGPKIFCPKWPDHICHL